MMAFGIKDEII